MLALSIHDARKVFTLSNGKTLTAVDTVSFDIQPGSIHGLLGPNGAGKSTLINLISGVMRPTSGTIRIFGHDIVTDTRSAKQLLGVVPQEIVTEMAFTVREVLYYYAGMFGVPAKECHARIDEVLEDLHLTDKANERARGLSGGMKRRLMIAKALIHKPKLLILDEPTAGVDVALRQRLWEVVRRLNKEGATVLLTTHYLEEAEQLCDRVTLVNHGKVIRDKSLVELRAEFAEHASLEKIFLELTRPV